MDSIINAVSELHHLTNGSTGRINPNLLDDFRFGNQRGKRTESEYQKLRQSVKKLGVTQSVGIRLTEDKQRAELIFGHGRRDAAIDEKLDAIPFTFHIIDDNTAFEMHLAENLDREDLNIVNLAKAASTYMTHFKGDYAAVASNLNMTETKLKGLLGLTKCTDKVLQALSDKKISQGHALLLAPFPVTAQDKNLDKVIAENWSVAQLKERAGKAKIPLERAKFDTKACTQCEFNSKLQSDLFGEPDAKAACAKSACFREKTNAFLHEKKALLEDKYGHILFLSQTNQQARNTLSVEQLGQKQFDACKSCDDNVTVMSDKYGQEGALTHNQCVNAVCFGKNRKAYLASIKPAPGAHNSNKAPQTTKATLSPSIKDHYKSFLRACADTFFDNNVDFYQSLAIAALIEMADFTHDTLGATSFATVLPKLMGIV